MHTINLDAWTDFPNALASIRAKFGTHTVDLGDKRFVIQNDMVFRGQSDSEWELETTLERITDEKYKISRYLERAGAGNWRARRYLV